MGNNLLTCLVKEYSVRDIKEIKLDRSLGYLDAIIRMSVRVNVFNNITTYGHQADLPRTGQQQQGTVVGRKTRVS